jgi:hypothetical protein
LQGNSSEPDGCKVLDLSGAGRQRGKPAEEGRYGTRLRTGSLCRRSWARARRGRYRHSYPWAVFGYSQVHSVSLPRLQYSRVPFCVHEAKRNMRIFDQPIAAAISLAAQQTQGRDESRKGRRARGGEAASCPHPANRDTTQDAGAIARPGACRPLAAKRIAGAADQLPLLRPAQGARVRNRFLKLIRITGTSFSQRKKSDNSRDGAGVAFISVSLQRSVVGRPIVNYIQWRGRDLLSHLPRRPMCRRSAPRAAAKISMMIIRLGSKVG